MGRLIGRIVRVGFGAASALTAIIFVLLTLGLERLTVAARGGGDIDPERAASLLAAALTLGRDLMSFPAALLPAVAVLIVGEVARIRSPLFYIGSGGLVLAAWPLLLRSGAITGGSALLGGWQVLATAGFAGGLVYWLIAGRKA